MANRYFNQFRLSLEKQVVDLFAKVTFGASGAPTLDALNSKGIKSIARTGAGAYTITLQDSYVRFLGIRHTAVSATAPTAPGAYVVSETVSSSTLPTVRIVFNAAGTATDPASGEVALIQIVLKNSTAQ